MMISKIEFKCFQINLMLELFMCLRLEFLELNLNLYSFGVRFHQIKLCFLFTKEKNVKYILTSFYKKYVVIFFKVL
jgi:hypothetical protein